MKSSGISLYRIAIPLIIIGIIISYASFEFENRVVRAESSAVRNRTKIH
ncbi:MAG: hypothetical protein Ct9H300mP29_5550 [Candidatus Neomarinimicrobiota bacterium]|nr:MAG: hypothetical protein Ct9H300mP29_5550 [Candidatus Neomarinimicrobiota bacterium]